MDFMCEKHFIIFLNTSADLLQERGGGPQLVLMPHLLSNGFSLSPQLSHSTLTNVGHFIFCLDGLDTGNIYKTLFRVLGLIVTFMKTTERKNKRLKLKSANLASP
jgi:hypothetical protein